MPLIACQCEHTHMADLRVSRGHGLVAWDGGRPGPLDLLSDVPVVIAWIFPAKIRRLSAATFGSS